MVAEMAGMFGRVKKQVGSLYTDPFRWYWTYWKLFVVVIVTSFEMSLWSLDGAWLSLLECLPLESTLQGKDIGSFPNFNPKVAADK